MEPMAVEAALEAERRRMDSRDERQRIADLELQQAATRLRWPNAAMRRAIPTIV